MGVRDKWPLKSNLASKSSYFGCSEIAEDLRVGGA